MQAPLTAEEARVRRNRLQARALSDAQSRFWQATGIAIGSALLSLPLYRHKFVAQCIPEYRLARKPIPFSSSLGAATHLWTNEGFLKLWRGVSPAMLFSVPALIGTQFAAINFAQDARNSPSHTKTASRGFAVATVSASITTFFNPLQIAHIKMATDLRYPEAFHLEEGPQMGKRTAQKSTPTPTLDPKQKQLTTFSPYRFRNWLYTLKRVYNINGSRSFGAALAPLWIYQFLHFASLFSSTTFLTTVGMGHIAPYAITIMASVFAAVTTQPFDTIRTRMLFRLPTDPDYRIKPYSGMLETAKYIWDHEGMKGFMRGTTSSIAIFGLSVGCSGAAITLLNAMARDRMQREYLFKMQQYAQEERAQALTQSRLGMNQSTNANRFD